MLYRTCCISVKSDAHQRHVRRESSTSTVRVPSCGRARPTAEPTSSRRSAQSRFRTSAPDSSRVMSSRLPTNRFSRSASVSMLSSRSSRAASFRPTCLVRKRRHRAEDRGERRPQIVAERGQQRGAQLVRLGQDAQLLHLAVEQWRARWRRRPGRAAPPACGAAPDRAGPCRARSARRARRRRRGRCASGNRPARHSACVLEPKPATSPFSHAQLAAAQSRVLEPVVGRIAGADRDAALGGHEHDHLGAERRGDLVRHRPQQVVERMRRRELAAEIVERRGGLEPPARGARLFAHAAGQVRGEDGDDRGRPSAPARSAGRGS